MNINAKKLETAMASKMLTAKMLAEKSGVSDVTITRVKNGIQKPKPVTIGKLAKALEVGVTEIID